MSRNLTDRLDQLAEEWTGTIVPTAPERVRARGRARRRRRVATGAILTCAALVATLVPIARSGLLQGRAIAPANGGTPGFTAPAAAQGQLRVRISDPPAGLPADLTLGGMVCDEHPDGGLVKGLKVTGRTGAGAGKIAAELYPTLADGSGVDLFDTPGGALGKALAPLGDPNVGVILIEGKGVSIDLVDHDGRRGSMSGRYWVLDENSGTRRRHPTGRLAFDWWCPAP
jgi:hypothetical protein